MKFGLKLWSTNQDILPQADQLIKADVFQYIELTPIPGTEIDAFLSYDLPYTIHITTERHGLNIADKEKRDLNIKTIQNNVEWADQLRSNYLILHPGYGVLSESVKFLNSFGDKRILIENMPKIGLNNEKMIGYSPEQIHELIGNKFGFCFDLNHAVKAAISMDMDYKEFIAKFLTFESFYFHISDGRLNYEKDEHLTIGKGDYDLDFLCKYMKSKSTNYITLETPRLNLKSFKEDIDNLDEIKSFLK